jgi:hypothetical protein
MTKGKNTYRFRGTGLLDSERKWAKRRFDNYIKRYDVESYSNLQLLEDLVFRESLQEKYKKKREEIEKTAKPLPSYLLENMNENEEQMFNLRDKLGFFKEKNIDDPIEKFNILEKKFDKWEETHAEERKVTCPFCSEVFFLHIRTDKYTESKLKLYKNKILCNAHLWKCYKEGKITKDDMALVLNVSPDYIDWLEKNIYNLPNS